MHKIKLRALTRDDLQKTLAWNNQEDIKNNYSHHPFPVNKEMEEKWYDKVLTSNFPVTVFGIEYCENNELIGISVLSDIDMINRSAEFANYIGDHNYRGKKLSREIVNETIFFGFEKLGLNRIYLRVFSDNFYALKSYESAGFITEGVLRKAFYKNNEFRDVIVMSMLKEEYLERRNLL